MKGSYEMWEDVSSCLGGSNWGVDILWDQLWEDVICSVIMWWKNLTTLATLNVFSVMSEAMGLVFLRRCRFVRNKEISSVLIILSSSYSPSSHTNTHMLTVITLVSPCGNMRFVAVVLSLLTYQQNLHAHNASDLSQERLLFTLIGLKMSRFQTLNLE